MCIRDSSIPKRFRLIKSMLRNTFLIMNSRTIMIVTSIVVVSVTLVVLLKKYSRLMCVENKRNGAVKVISNQKLLSTSRSSISVLKLSPGPRSMLLVKGLRRLRFWISLRHNQSATARAAAVKEIMTTGNKKEKRRSKSATPAQVNRA